MDQRLKERLIGAVVLVALAVWLIPWLLDGSEHEPGAETVALNLPAAEESAPTKSVTIDLDDRGRPEVPADNAATAGEAASARAAGGGQPEAAQSGAGTRAGRSSSSEAAGDARAARAADAEPDGRAGGAAADTAGPAQQSAAGEPETGASASVPSASGSETAADESGAAASGSDTAASDSATAASESEAAAGEQEPAGAGGWAVQLGSFSEARNAERLSARIETYGYEPDVSTYRRGGRDLHRVRVGPQPSRARAEAVASALTAHGFVAQVVTAD